MKYKPQIDSSIANIQYYATEIKKYLYLQNDLGCEKDDIDPEALAGWYQLIEIAQRNLEVITNYTGGLENVMNDMEQIRHIKVKDGQIKAKESQDQMFKDGE